MKTRGSSGCFAIGRRAAGATSWLLVFFAAVLLGAPSPTVAKHRDEDKPHGPLTQPRGCYKRCNKLKLGYYIHNPKDTRASGPHHILGNYNYERYVLDPAAANVVGSLDSTGFVDCCQKCAKKVGCRFWHLKPSINGEIGQCTLLGSLAGITVRNWDIAILPTFLGGECNPLANTNDDPHFRGADGTQYDFNGLLDRSFCLVSDRRIHINMGIKGYQPIANLPGTATSLDEESLAAAVEAAVNEKKPRHIRQLEQERLSVEELSELEKMRANGSLPLTDEVVAALDRETGRRSGEEGAGGEGEEKEQHSIQYAKHELKARLLKGKPIRSWIRELQLMWRDETGAQHSAFFKARDGKEQGRGSSGFIDRMELDGSPVAPPLSEGSSIVGSGGFKLLLAETKSCKGKDEDEFHLTIDGLVDMGISARLAHPLMQTATEAQAHFNVHIARLNHTSGIHGVLGQTFRAEESRKVRSLRYRLLTRLLREPVEVESESGRGFLDGRTEDYITSDIHSADCMYAAAWRRGEHENSDGSDFM